MNDRVRRNEYFGRGRAVWPTVYPAPKAFLSAIEIAHANGVVFGLNIIQYNW